MTNNLKSSKQYISQVLKSHIKAEAKKRNIPIEDRYVSEIPKDFHVDEAIEKYLSKLEKHFDSNQITTDEDRRWNLEILKSEKYIYISKSASEEPLIGIQFNFTRWTGEKFRQFNDIVTSINIIFPQYNVKSDYSYRVEYIEEICDMVADLYDSYTEDVNDGIIKSGKDETSAKMTITTIKTLVDKNFKNDIISMSFKLNGKMIYGYFVFQNGKKGLLKFSLAKFDNDFSKILKAIEGFITLSEVEGIDISYGDIR